MKRIFILVLFSISIYSLSAQIQVNDSTFLFMDSLYAELPEVMVTGERPIVKAEEGKLVYDLPRLVHELPVDNAYDAMKELPGIVEQNDALTLAGSSVHVLINGKLSTLTSEQLTDLLKTIPVSRLEKAEVLYSAPARYQVRGPMINLILQQNEGTPTLQGELYSSWKQLYYESFTERASLLYSTPKFSTDLLYSYTHGRNRFNMDKEALHTVNGVVYPMEQWERSMSRSNNHQIRWGMDYNFSKDNVLSWVYTTQLRNNKSDNRVTGIQVSQTRKDTDSYLHNAKMDYKSSFGLTTGAEFTFYNHPSDQELHSVLNNENVDARYEDNQRINKWYFYAMQEHTLRNNWGINYGVNYTTTVDNSFQYYFDTETGEYHPENSMKSRRREYIWNGFAGFNKQITPKLSMDASFAAELYHTNLWDEWMFYPTLNMTYLPSPGHIWQLAFSSDKAYPSFWDANSSVAYMSAYSEIHGNPDLKPSQKYNASLTYILKSKYVFTAYYNHQRDYFVQTLYQRPDELVEVYKVLNFDYRRQIGLQATIPFRIQNWLNSRVTLIGCHTREKDKDFWDIPFDRSKYALIGVMNHSVTLSNRPDLRLNISGFYQSGANQGIYDLNSSFNMDASLRWTFAREKAQLTLKGFDLFDTSAINPKIRFENQNVTNRFTHPTRGVELSFSYKFGRYKEKQREEVDTSRFK